MPSAASRWDSTRPAGPAPTMPTWVRSTRAGPGAASPSGIAVLLQHPLGDREGGVGGGHAAVDGGLEEHLPDLVGREPVAPGATHMELELVHPAERGEHGEGDARP